MVCCKILPQKHIIFILLQNCDLYRYGNLFKGTQVLGKHIRLPDNDLTKGYRPFCYGGDMGFYCELEAFFAQV